MAILVLTLISTCESFKVAHRHVLIRPSIRKMVGDDAGNNLFLSSAWLKIKEILPPIVHGAWKRNAGNENPAGAIYNVLFVRIPTIVIAAVYANQLLTNSEFRMDFDFGFGPIELPSPVIASAFVVILL